MDILTDLTRWVYGIRIELWEVIVGAVLLVWIVRAAEGRQQQNYDAWWLENVPGAKSSPARLLRPKRERKRSDVR
jgi:hypothetical protein